MGFFYYIGGTAEPPCFFCNPHGMDHHGYDFKTNRSYYMG
jgi:hypothetical protein